MRGQCIVVAKHILFLAGLAGASFCRDCRSWLSAMKRRITVLWRWDEYGRLAAYSID